MLANNLISGQSLATVQANEEARSQATQAQPIIQSLASHVRQMWVIARDARRISVDSRMLQALRQRRGEYDPEKLAQIKQMGGSEIYALLTSVKCRAAAAWITDVMSMDGTDKPWTISPTPDPEVPPAVNDAIVQQATAPIAAAIAAGAPMDNPAVVELLMSLKDQAKQEVLEQARLAAERMERKMLDQLVEGGFTEAMDEFIDDLVTFPTAIMCGPIVRKRKQLTWPKGPGGVQGGKPVVTEVMRYEWERVSPFDFYPSPAATCIDDGFMIRRHRLSRGDLLAMVGVEGYDEAAIKSALVMYALGGLHEWLMIDDIARAQAENRQTIGIMRNPDGLIDAIQYWGSVPGRLLLDWGLTADEVPDSTQEYNVEVWVVGSYVIKATLNYDALGRKPYYATSYENIPGSFWGNGVPDLVRDPQTVVNAAARAIVNNMGMASGPQVTVNVSRLAKGEQITSLTPWRIWQVVDDPMNAGASQSPVQFFQPDSRVAELMAVYEKFAAMGDDYSGIPKYLSGQSSGGAGRTASGLSMLIDNAGKLIKKTISGIDERVIEPLLSRLYYMNMLYADDPDLKGDVQIQAKGANALQAKESAQVRRNEFLAATNNPTDMAIVGLPGRGAVLREVAKGLDMDPDKIVPSPDVLKQKQAVMEMVQQQAAAADPKAAAKGAGTPAAPPGAVQPAVQQQAIPSPGMPSPPGQALMGGAPQTDNFSPPAQA